MAEAVGSRTRRLRPRTSSARRFAPAGLLVLIGVALFGSTGRDDAYITYWAADVLARTGRIVSYNGEHLEQSSSLLHTIVLAVVSLVTPLSTPAAGWLVGVMSGLAAALLAVVVADRIEPGSGWTAGLFAGTTAYLVYWSFGGLETPLAAAAFLVALLAFDHLATHPERVPVATLGVLPYVLVRPEAFAVLGGLAAAALALAVLARRWPLLPDCGGVSVAARCLLASVVATVLVVAFRLAYFGDAVPQPVHVKVNGLRLSDGVDYARQWLWRPDTVVLIAVALLVLRGLRRTPLETFVGLGALVQLGFVIGTGGDWMEAGRFFVPFLTVVAVLAAVGVSRVPARRVITIVVVAAQLLGLVLLARNDSTGRPLWASFTNDPTAGSHLDVPWYEATNRVHVRDAAFEPVLVSVIDRLHQRLGRRVTITSGQAGMVMYYAAEQRGDDITFIDRGRLTGDAFTRCPEGLVSSEFGKVMPISYWFTHVEKCGVPLPDIVFGLGDLRALALDGQYVLAGSLPSRRIEADGPLHGVATDAAEFVAVRADLAGALGP